MKSDKSPTNKETPSKKILKQARLPFKIIRTDVSPSPSPPQTKKRKLSENDSETPSKIGKVCKENDLVDDLIVLSDDNSQDGSKLPKEEQTINPLLTIVDKARKKKLQKSKSKKKTSKVKKNDSLCSDTATDTNHKNETAGADVEMMDVDIPSNLAHTKNSDETAKSPNNIPEPTVTHTESLKSNQNYNDILILEDSNNSSDDKSKRNDTVTENLTEVDTTNNVNKREMENKSTDVIVDNTKDDIDITQPPTLNQETPRRSIRNKTKMEESELNSSTSSSKLDESICSDSTPKHNNVKISVTSDESAHESTGSNNLTPKQLQKKLESAKKKEEREKEKQEREKKRQQEKEERAKQKQEKEEQKKREREEKEEAKKREKEEKEEQKKKEREEKERQKELEKKLKEEKEEQKRIEREEKEEQRKKEKEAKEEEKRKKQEALEQERLEQELKKKKAAEAFLNFFVPKQKTDKDQTTVGPVSKNSMLSSFTIKFDMRLAPIIRNNLSKDKQKYLDNILKEQNVSESDLYLKSLKSGAVKPGSSGKTWPLSDKDDDVMIIEDELPPIDGAGEILTCESAVREKLRPKLLSFHENRRPPYWGTWRKKSASIKPRRPFGQDEKLDYEIDSDEEWEEEEGESIDGSAAGSDDEQGPDEYEVDNELFVPHGYLSDEEATMDDDDVMSLSPETQKAKLKHLEDEFESEMKKPTEKLKPRLYGLLWETSEGGKPENCVDDLWNYFGKFSMIMNDPRPLLQPSNEPEETEKKKKKKTVKESNEGDQQSPKNKKKKANPETKESKKTKAEVKKQAPETKNQPAINSFLSKLKPT